MNGFAVDDLAEFVVAASPDDMSDAALKALRRNVLDSLGCAYAALDGETLRAVRDQIDAVGGIPRATLIGGGRATVEQSTLFNSLAVRYVDMLDTYLTPGGLCHPADNFRAILAVAESVGASGADFLLALAVAYEVQIRFSASVPVMAFGIKHALQLAMSVAAGSARLLGLTADQTADAIAIAAADNVSLAAIHSEPVSNWKGVSPGITAQRAVFVTDLARRGVTGPRGVIDGPNGLESLFGQTIDLRLAGPSINAVTGTYLKQYSALIHGQTPIETLLTMVDEHGLHVHDVGEIDVAVFQTAYDIAGGGKFGAKDSPQTKEQADYNLKYLLAVALLDGRVGPDQLQADRIRRPDVQELLSHIVIHADDALTSSYPEKTPARITLTRTDGTRVTRTQDDYHGAPSRPFDWADTVEKFHRLSTPHTTPEIRERIVEAVANLDGAPLSTLTGLLSTKEDR